MYRKILLPLDGSELSELAIPHARELARAMDAEIVLLQVVDSVDRLLQQVEPPHRISRRSSRTESAAGDEAARQRAAAEKYLAGPEAELRQAGQANVSALIREGDPGRQIERAVKERACDVVVMSTHGRSGITRALLGSVADHIVRHIPDTPVLLVRA
jgi:nucleotide-binding universal stress UspA family protein